MRLDSNTVVDPNYTKFCNYIDVDFPKLIDNKQIVEALRFYGKMEIEEIENVLFSGTGPFVRIISDDDLKHHDRNNLYLSPSDVDDYQNDADILITQYGRKVHFLGVNILQSIVVVYSDHNFVREYEFTRKLYGVDLTHLWRQKMKDGSLKVSDKYNP
jgi:hypothetical protein